VTLEPIGLAPSPLPAVSGDGPVLARRLASASVVSVVLAAACYLLMVRTSFGQRLDNAAYLGARSNYTSVAAADTSQLHRITADSLAVALLVLVAIGALRRRLLLGLGAALAAGVAVVVTDVLEYHIATRPNLVGAGPELLLNTFPSGHTAAAVACAMALVLVAAPRWRGVAAVVAGAYGWVTAAQVQTAGWHRPSDAVGGALLAFAAVTAVAAILAAGRPVRWQPRVHHRVALGLLVVVGLLDGAVGVVRLLGVVHYLHARALGAPVSGGIRHDAYIVGLTFTVDAVVVLLIALLALLGRADLDGWGWRRRPSRPGRV
jgi:membrane-associated phospholipid phosphatase